MKQAVALLFIAGITAGCASQGVHPDSVTEYTYDPSASLAKNVADAAGIDGLEDLPREDYEALVAENPELRGIDPRGAVGGSSDTTKLLGATAAGAAGVMDPIAGLGDLTTGALGALSWLAEDNRSPAQKNWRVIWLPEGETLIDFERKAAYAYAQALGYDPDDLEAVYYDKRGSDKNISLGTPNCPLKGGRFQKSCSFTIDSTYYSLSTDDLGSQRNGFELPQRQQAPGFIDIDSQVRGPILVTSYRSDAGATSEDYDIEVLREYSEKLPSYAYFYVSQVGSDRIAPRVIHQGRQYFFIEP